MFLSGEDLFQFFLKMGLKEFLLLEQTWTEGFLLHCWRFYFYSCFFGSPQLAKFHMNPIISTLYWHFSPSSSWANSCCRNETGGKEARHNLWKNDIATCVCAHSLSRVRLFETPWTVAHQAPLYMEFSSQEYWSGLPSVCHNYWACAAESQNCNYWAHVLQLLKAEHPKTHALQQEKPVQWEACVWWWRVAPDHHNYRKAQELWRPSTVKNK